MISVFQIFPKRMQEGFRHHNIQSDKLQEVRMRIGHPVLLVYDSKEFVLTYQNKEIVVTREMLKETLEYMSGYSLYAFEQELRQGFITIEGGHRVGVTGKVILEQGLVKNFQHISSLNLRISHEMIGCGDKLFPWILKGDRICNTLIISPPGCGKTTLLRDLVRQISDGNTYIKGMTTGVVDERSEIGGSYMGVPQNQLGIRTDVLDCCPKAEGMLMLIRSMAPKVIVVDEIGTFKDVEALTYCMHSGCNMFASVHGASLEEISRRPLIGDLIRSKSFERYVILGNKPKIGTVQKIYDNNGNILIDFLH